jgi:hypothetical protein
MKSGGGLQIQAIIVVALPVICAMLGLEGKNYF